jgi:hypothetical protein
VAGTIAPAIPSGQKNFSSKKPDGTDFKTALVAGALCTGAAWIKGTARVRVNKTKENMAIKAKAQNLAHHLVIKLEPASVRPRKLSAVQGYDAR